MSIVSLLRVRVIAPVETKHEVLSDLQDMGCLHLIPLRADDGQGRNRERPSSRAREALMFLLSCPQKRRQAREFGDIQAADVETKAMALKQRLLDLNDERDFLIGRIGNLGAWGEFALPPVDELGGLRLWFYRVPHNKMRHVKATELIWEVVRRDNRFCYVAVISADEPEGMPVYRTHTGSVHKARLEERLQDVEVEIEDAIAERISMTRWCSLFARSLDKLEDRESLAFAATMTHDSTPLFGLEGWAPRDQLERLESYCADKGLYIDSRDPDPDETPPTLLRNTSAASPGEDLVNFYMTPGYWTWDPSTVVLASFALFFAMILSDAGYAALLGFIMAYFWRRMGGSATGLRMRRLFAVLVGASLVYGVLCGGYFGVTPSPDSLAGRLKLLDVTDATTMMFLSIVIGVVHVALANLMEAYRLRKHASALAPLGWASLTVGGLLFWLGMQSGRDELRVAGAVLGAAGVAGVLIFSGAGSPPVRRAAAGVLALTKITGAFGDVMSYLRLFALGMATASLAAAFNDMAAQIRVAQPGVGLLLALLVLLIGHSLNFLLGIVSAVVHGMRLNVIEFFKWGLTEEGKLFKPFQRKESPPWTPSS